MSYRSRSKYLNPRENSVDDEKEVNESNQPNTMRRKSIHKSSSTDNNQSYRVYNSIYWRYIILLLSLWIVVIHYYERTVVKRAMRNCEWSNWEKWPENAESYKVGLFADPQIMDKYSYPGRLSVVNYATRLLLDNYHKRNWKFVQYYLDPDASFFLGDLFDGGRYWEDDYWHAEYERFNRIFPKKPNRKTVMSIPGNHDIGFGDTIIESSLKRFSTYFGETSTSLDLGNHTFVLLDTISLSDKQNMNISDIPKEFLNNFANNEYPYPKVLLTHVPLWRNPEYQKCGNMRESGKPFPLGKGDQYQTVIDEYISQKVLTKIQPSILFSGDDHDYCQVTHSYHANGESKIAEEITVKSCAMNMGINRPAIQLVSLYNPQEKNLQQKQDSNIKTYQTNICYLPDPYKPIKMYSITALISILLILYIHVFPKSFNKNVVENMEKIFKNRKAYSQLPLPVTASLNANYWIEASNYQVFETKSKISLGIHCSILAALVLVVFTYYYSML